ncbi:hypothetical protein EGW08_006903, partial [Elysia chlorotica]
ALGGGENSTGKWRRRSHGVIPVACKAEAEQSEIMAMKPVKFLKNFKNPCWWERIQGPISDLYLENSYINYSYTIFKTFKKLKILWSRKRPPVKYRLRCLPYFFLAGQPKCGSTDIYQRLVAHPEIVVPPVKESHYWGKNRYGDGSVSTLWCNDDWWKNPENCGLLEPRYTNAHHIHRLIPQARIIVILRNPVDRLYSDFLYFQTTEKAREHFHRDSVQAIDALEECTQVFALRSCVYNYTIASKSRARLRLGLYFVFLQEWLSVFPRDQILVARLEDYSVEPLKTVARVHKFLGLRSMSAQEAAHVLEKPVANSRREKDKKIGKMLPETRAILTSFYHKYNVQLARLLGDDRFLWDDPDR